MIESIKIKLATGKEIELTQEEARLLAAELREVFGKTEYIPLPTYPPVSVPFVQTPDWFRPPYKITCTGDPLPLSPEITWYSATGYSGQGRQQ